MNSREFQDRLAKRARRAGVALAPELGARLEVYFRLLTAWNEKINLTGLNLTEQGPDALDRLLVEPLVAASHAPASITRMIDVGSGGGSPAIPFALSVPGVQLLLVEAKTRKSVFLREALRALELGGAEVATSRFEELLSKPELHEAHELLTIRAVRIESSVLMNLQAFIKPGGELFLFRSTSAAWSPNTVTPPLAWKATYPLLDRQGSRLVVLEKKELGANRSRKRST
ncbi:MAG TPA: RsmG family class I SAM-dependent methyltransferase [Vicinamibacterales bacterium]|nr:RsmG family class I SAM-dependent methyltransferase [Vicinamibacterales bacterium]